jgi:hypothetical protein
MEASENMIRMKPFSDFLRCFLTARKTDTEGYKPKAVDMEAYDLSSHCDHAITQYGPVDKFSAFCFIYEGIDTL